MTKIKTITFLIKCLKIDIPIYKDVQNITVRINRVMVYKTSLIELLTYLQEGSLYINISREHADALIAAAQEADKARNNAEVTPKSPAQVPPQPVLTEEPGYEQIQDEPHDVSGQVAGI